MYRDFQNKFNQNWKQQNTPKMWTNHTLSATCLLLNSSQSKWETVTITTTILFPHFSFHHYLPLIHGCRLPAHPFSLSLHLTLSCQSNAFSCNDKTKSTKQVWTVWGLSWERGSVETGNGRLSRLAGIRKGRQENISTHGWWEEGEYLDSWIINSLYPRLLGEHHVGSLTWTVPPSLIGQSLWEWRASWREKQMCPALKFQASGLASASPCPPPPLAFALCDEPRVWLPLMSIWYIIYKPPEWICHMSVSLASPLVRVWCSW